MQRALTQESRHWALVLAQPKTSYVTEKGEKVLLPESRFPRLYNQHITPGVSMPLPACYSVSYEFKADIKNQIAEPNMEFTE